MIILLLSFLLILISCFELNKNDDNFNNILKYLNSNIETEKDNFNKIYTSSEKYLHKLKTQEEYLKFIKDINNNYYYPLNKKKSSLFFNLIPTHNLINNDNCFSYHIIIGKNKNIFLLCINNEYNLLSLFNLTTEEHFYKNIIEIPISISLNFSFPIHISFSAFEEEQTKIYIFNNQIIYSIILKLNFILDEIKISNIKNFSIPDLEMSSNLPINIDNNLIYLSTTLYHGNRYIIYGYSTGEIKVYLIRDKSKDDYYISVRTTFNLHKNIYKIYQIQGYLFVVTDNKKKINVLSLLGSNSILVNCYNYNEIIDLVFEFKKNLLYILDSKGNIIIKELVLSVSKAYTNTCNNIYYLQIPKYITEKHNTLNKKMNLVMTKDLNTIYITGLNYIGYINSKFTLENYILYNQNNKKNNLEDNGNIFIKGSMSFLLATYNKKLLIYEIKSISDENTNNNKDKKNKNKTSSKETKTTTTALYNTIDDNSGIVECNGNVICKLLFNSVTNNKYTINTLYVTCIIIIFSTVYHCNKNKNDKRKMKTFKEDNLDNKESNDKLSEMLKKIKNMEKFENFSDYKKRKKDSEKLNNLKGNKFFEDDNDEIYKDYYGDDDEDENDLNENEKEQNSDEFLEKAYHSYVKDMLNKEKKKNNNFDISEDEDDNNINNYENNNNTSNRNNNRFEERKDQSSQDDSEEGRLNTD